LNALSDRFSPMCRLTASASITLSASRPCRGRALESSAGDTKRVQVVKCGERFPEHRAMLDTVGVYYQEENKLFHTDKMCSYRYL
jgi:hypothetical protein